MSSCSTNIIASPRPLGRTSSGRWRCYVHVHSVSGVTSAYLSLLLWNYGFIICSATYILGPLKSRLSREMGTNNTEFSLLISAFSLNSTWTPLLGGLLASRLGTTFTSIMATGIIFIGP